jgi:putative hydroxymethylpyrimidine transport system substrate-binding protein
MLTRISIILTLLPMFLAANPLHVSAKSELTVMLDWFVNPDHGPLIIAHEKGFFSQMGLDVNIVAPANPNDPPKLVAAGKVELAISYQPQLHVQVSEGLPLIRIGTLVATPLNSLVVLKEGDIKNISDLKGKKIGFSVGGFEDAMLAAMLEKHGVSINDVELINVNFALSPAILSGKVDAIIGAFRNFELNQLNIVGRPGRAFYPEEEGVPSYDELIIIAHKDKVRDPRFGKFIEAIEKSVQFMINHPDESWRLFIKEHVNLDDELNKRAWKDTIPRFALRPGALDRKRYQRFSKFLKTQGLIKNIPPVSDYAIELQ